MAKGRSQKKKNNAQTAKAPVTKHEEQEPKRASFNIVSYFKDVFGLVDRVSWPSRKSTITTTCAVLLMVSLTCVFFLGIDQIIGLGIRTLFKVGG